LNPTDVILKYHGGNKQYTQPEGSEIEFASLDTTISKKKIILLVQIGKEGWDCKSLTGVILPQKGVCPTNMVLQTSCRCLRQVVKNSHETALIWLNKFNADKLNRQLEQQQNITLKEFSNKPNPETKMIDRFSRMEKMQVPPIEYYQLKVNYETLVIDENNNPAERLQDSNILVTLKTSLIHQQDMERKLLATYEQANENNVQTSFRWWLQQIAKESFGTLSVSELKKYEEQLHSIFEQITIKKDGVIIENNKYDHQSIRSNIRKAFIPIRDISVKEEILPEKANLLKIEKLTSQVEDSVKFFPDQQDVHDIISWDTNPPQQELSEEQKAKIEELKAMGVDVSALLKPKTDPHPERNQTYHYLPYRFDSDLERKFLSEEIRPLIAEKNLEVYFNGDDTLTDFIINCYSKDVKGWRKLGNYVPDFLLLSRNENHQIDKVIIIETKGEGYAAKFKEKKDFMEKQWVEKNNEKFGYKRFHFLYLEDTLTQEQRRQKTLDAIKDFFNM
jgi:hypothetical protein